MVTTDLTGKTALVTGAGRGIGRAIALALARAGAKVGALARTAEQIRRVVGQMGDAGGEGIVLPCDLADEQQIVAAFARVRDRWGRLDVLVNNAAVGRYDLVQDVKAEDIDAMLRVNVRGAMLCCREAMRIMVPQRSGYVINISSVVGVKGYVNQAGYTATKHAIMGLTKTLAAEGQEHGVRVSAILPGGVDTEMVRTARPDLDPTILLQPEDIAQTVLYLLSLSDRAAIDQIYIRRRPSQPF